MTRRVAIIGASHRFPSRHDESFWDSLRKGQDLVTEVAPERWDHDVYRHPNRQHPGTSVTFAAGSLGDISGFDAAFFGISPREAAHMEPQQRMLLELAWEAMEHAGVAPSKLRGSRCGVYIGISSLDYTYRHADDLQAMDAPSATGNTSSIAANRLSYVFDLKGPSMALDTACSSSLVAFHQACQAIRHGECDTALAGGISLHLHPFGFIVFSKASMLSANGRCRVFDEAGDGYVRSEGAGIFLLKDYDTAVADGDRILAVVAGSAVNTDGHKTGLTVPNADAQIALMRQAYADAGISADDIDYLEAHGTGTAVGDPIETHAIGQALGQGRSRPLPIGSVKSNVGHLETASGVAGLFKGLYSLIHREVPATIGIRTPNPRIKLDDWNLEIVAEPLKLADQGPLTIGVNSFGFGGANAHVILQSAPEPVDSARQGKPGDASPSDKSPSQDITADDGATTPDRALPLRFSANSPEALVELAVRLAEHLRQADTSLYDLAYALDQRRDRLKHGGVVFAEDRDSAAAMLEAFAQADASVRWDVTHARSVVTGTAQADASGPVLVYSGNGCQWFGMGRDLLNESPLFADAIDRIDALFMPLGGFSLRAELEGVDGDRLERTEIAQPTLFAIQVAITQVFEHWGIRPAAVIGHSVGEVAAAWASGALTLDEAVSVITQRSHFQGMTRGQGVMTAVVLDADSTAEWLEDPRFNEISLAGDNSRQGVTLAGPEGPMAALEKALGDAQIASFRLPLDYAFHSPAMDVIKDDVVTALADIRPREARCPFYSTVAGAQLDTRELDGHYWWRNIREPVSFTPAMEALLDTGANVFVEIGAHPVLRRYLNDALKARQGEGLVITTLERDADGIDALNRGLGRLWLCGITIDDSRIFPLAGDFVELPLYPWQRESFWITPSGHGGGLIDRHIEHPLLGYRLAQQRTTWHSQLDVERLPWLADHVVGQAAVFPGAGYVEMALAAAIHHRAPTLVDIESLEIHAPLMLDAPHGRQTRLTLSDAQGHITIDSRDTQEAGDWQRNASARLMAESAGSLLEQTPPTLPSRAPDVTLETHLAMASRLGLDYGPAFQAIPRAWREGDTMLGEIVPTGAEGEPLHLSPGILDSAFQLFLPLLADSEAAAAGYAFVPIRIDRLQFRANAGRPALAKARLRGRAPHSFTADFSLFDAEGRCLAHLDATRFRLVRLKNAGHGAISLVGNVLTPAPHSRQVDDVTLDALAKALPDALHKHLQKHRQDSGATADDVAPSADRRYAAELAALLNRLSEAFADQALSQLGHHQRLERAEFERYLLEYPGSAAQWRQLVAQLEASGGLVADDQGWTRIDEDERLDPAPIWQLLIDDYPDDALLIQRLGRHGLHLSELLTGQRDAAAIGLTPASLSALAPHTLGQSGWQALGRCLAAALSAVRESIQGECRRLGVIETGVGAPRLSEALSPLVDPDHLDLHLIVGDDDSRQRATRLKERCPLITLESAGEAPAAERRRAQLGLIMVDTVDHEASRRQLQDLGERLVPGAALLVLHAPGAPWWDALAATPALTQGDNPRLCEKTDLEEMLAELAQGNVNATPLDEGDESLVLYSLRLPERPAPGTEEASRAQAVLPAQLLVHNEATAEAAKRLADALSAAGGQVSRLALPSVDIEGENAALDATLAEATRQTSGQSSSSSAREDSHPTSPPLNLIDLRGLNDTADEIERCDRLAHWVRRLENISQRCRLWVLTRGVASLFADQPAGVGAATTAAADNGPDAATPADAATWGFARSLANELSQARVTLVDLDLNPPSGQAQASSSAHLLDGPILQALTLELCCPGEETELVLGAEGQRFATRLRVQTRDAKCGTADAAPGAHVAIDSAPTAVEPTLPPLQASSLGVTLPGQLRHLHWQPRPLRQLGEQDVSVRVQATGLNFRDVMYTLGLLSDEAIENGFAGASLGLEFAGVIEHVGEGISDLAPGDAVVGFGPSSFSDRVVATRGSVTPLPDGISFAAAATIPTTFFTVFYALKQLARLAPGERVLIHGAAGGVGLAAIQVARWLGADIYATVGSQEKADFLRLYGVDRLYNSRALTFAEEILRDTDGRGVDVVLNSLAGEAINQNLRALAPFGRFLELGKRDFYENTPIGLRPFRNNLSYFGIDSDQLMKLRPALTESLFGEMMALFNAGTLHPLPYTAFDHHRVIDAFRYMQQARQIGKLVVTRSDDAGTVAKVPAPATRKRSPLQLDTDASYLVTGGLSGFGLRTAEWLAERGAGHLVLLGRRGATTDEAEQGIARIRALGAEVSALACDITDAQALARVIADCGVTRPPLKGVVHAATVIDDGLIRHLDRERIERVLAPKIQGARHLDALTQGLDLHLFVLYSSATTLFGNPGQANYVAANTWLEALAARRRRNGLPAICVCWGAIEDVGFLARHTRTRDALQERLGGSALRSSQALELLGRLLEQDRSGIGALELDWHALARFLPTAAAPRFVELAEAAGEDNQRNEGNDDLRQRLAGLSTEDMQAELVSLLKEELATILLIDAERIDSQQSVYELGFDSLMGVELMTAIEARLDVQLSVMVMSEANSLDKLAHVLVRKLTQEEGDTGDDTLLSLASAHGGEAALDPTRENVE
ncbi:MULTISPECIES: type I polyketide synthase [unclassified Halomonas]|uniref:type I polyketide synthase n=1 Tax=unclassified Halomonas TaxID=2609666 RepID=UPI001C937F9E|nr:MULTISPECIES: type I polyketide synthase [unclassified Halomonas]MBY5926532.1 type I polyketide synthase [Halomonas sp. DP4Y7-2]MBY6233755.1 type I polyketide synthase [Halomonas sp. DP4Y7-1]